jgi:hypothetical protein
MLALQPRRAFPRECDVARVLAAPQGAHSSSVILFQPLPTDSLSVMVGMPILYVAN